MKTKKTSILKYYICAFMIVATSIVGLSATKIEAYAASGSTTVYTTNTGKCYHSDGCSSLSKSKNKTTLEKAVAKGLTPCSKCKPPRLDDTSKAEPKEKKAAPSTSGSDQLVWKSATGSCYHSKNNCGKMNPNKATQLTESEAKAQGLSKCSKCW